MAQPVQELRRRAADPNRVPPHNLEAEESLLGAMLLSRDAIAAAVEEGVTTDDFYKPSHSAIFDAILALSGRGEPADPVTVSEELRRAGVLDHLGGKPAILRIQANTPASTNAVHYARIVQELALLRRLIAVAGEIAEMGYEAPDDVAEVLDRAEAMVFDVAERRVSNTLVVVHSVLEETLVALEALYGRDVSVTGVPSGYIELDERLLGLQPSSLVVVAARPSMGKTSFALGAASHVAVQLNRPVLFFSMEMGHLELTQRLLAAEARVNAKNLRTGRLSDDEWRKISHAVGRLGEAPFYIDDNPHCTLMEMRAKARRLKARHGDLALVVVDYLQLMTTPNRAESRQVEVSELSRGLKILARELETPVMALSQLNRQPEMRHDKRPMLADLRESGCLTADTRVMRADTGEMVALGQLLATGARDVPVWTLDADYRLTRGVMSRVFRSGVKPVYRLRMRSGIEVDASPNHPFLTLDGWRRLDELSPGERLALPRRVPEPERTTPWRDDEVVLLAHLLGAGCLAGDQPVHYTSTDPGHLEVVERAALAFGVTARRVDRGMWWQSYLSTPYHPIAWRRNPIVVWLERLGVHGRGAAQAFVPDPVFALPRRHAAMFVRHLWAAAGTVAAGPDGAVLSLRSPSRDLVAGVQLLLLRFGVLGRVVATSRPGRAPGYELRVAGERNRRRFVEEIGVPAVPESRAGELRRLLAAADHPSRWHPSRLPAEVGVVRHRGDPRQPAFASAMGTTYYGPTLVPGGEPSPGWGEDEPEGVAETDLLWDRVDSITYLGEMPVYDATVPGTHNFVANGLVVHNSIEQDADVVAFIYRDDAYNTESPERGVAEIIIAKHRNGPTGMVKLAFLDHLAKFENMARLD